MPLGTGRKRINVSEVESILIRSTNWVGDVVMTLPALEAIRANFPRSKITVLARPWVLHLFKDHPAVDELIVFQKGQGFLTNLKEVYRIVELIRKRRFDLAILFQNAFEAALLTCLGHVKFRVGYNTDGRGLLLTHKVPRNAQLLGCHQVEYYLSLLRALGWNAESRDPHLYISAADVEKAKDLLYSSGIKHGDFIVALNPGAVFGGAKRWPADRFARVGDWAMEKWAAKVIVVGSKNEIHICNSLCSSMKNRPVNFCGETSLGEAMGLISLCGFFVTNDSGLMHVAASMGVPTLAVFGSTDPVATGPRGTKARVIRHETECAPCLKSECPQDHRCMLSIQAEEVWREMERLREGTS